MSEEIIAVQDSDQSAIECIPQNSLPEKLQKSITSVLAKKNEESILRVISESIESNAIRKKARKIINPETTYIARIPRKLEDDMKTGLLDFMKDSKTGDNLGVLINGKNKIKGHVRIEELKESVEISGNIATIAVQQQLAKMTEVINDVRSRVIALQEGHDDDLFGSIRGMHKQMVQIRDAKDPETQKQLTYQAITVLNDTRGKIEQAVIHTLNDMPIVPDKDLKIIWEITKDANYISSVNEKYNRVEELVSYYLAATQLLGYAYSFLGEENSFEDIFTPFPELLNEEMCQKLIHAENIYKEEIKDVWYKCPSDYMLQLKEASHRLFAKKEDDVIEIEISGEKLLEVI